MDLKTVRTRSINHEHYIVDIIDDNSDKPWIYCRRKKSDAFAMALKVFVNTVCKPRGIHYFALRIDNAGELTSHEVQAYCATNGIHLMPVPAYRHAFNEVAEKFFDTLLCMIRCMLESTHMPAFLWSHAARHACRLIGACPKVPDWTTPDWKWDGSLPDVSGFQTFGCRVYTHVSREIGTLDARGEEMRYLGCSHDSHFHHLYRAHDRRVFTTDDVTFVETDIQLPDNSGNIKIELTGLQRLTEDEQRLVDAHAERDDEVDWEQLQLASIPEPAEHDDVDDVLPSLADMRDSDGDDVPSLPAVEMTKSNSPIVAHAPDGVRPGGPGPIMRKSNSPIVAHAPDGVRQDGPGPIMRKSNSPIVAHAPDGVRPDGPGPIMRKSNSPIVAHAPDGVRQEKDLAPLLDEDDDATDTESVLATLTHSSRGPTVEPILLLMLCTICCTAPRLMTTSISAFIRRSRSPSLMLRPCGDLMQPSGKPPWKRRKRRSSPMVPWRIVPIDHSWNLLSSKWVFKIKSDEHGHITRYRARLVAKGFLQREGMDNGDIFSPVLRYSTLRILLALAAHYGLFKRHLDCPKAFTQADLDTPCNMKAPPGMKIPIGW
jgi:hypothetical protein